MRSPARTADDAALLELVETTQLHKLPGSSRHAMQIPATQDPEPSVPNTHFWLSREGARSSTGAMEGDSFLVEIWFSLWDAQGSPSLYVKQSFVFGIKGKELRIVTMKMAFLKVSR